MASSFILNLDMTPPILTVTIPKYKAYSGEPIEIEISSNEELSDNQIVSLTDHTGLSRSYLLPKIDESHLYGELDLTGLAFGILELHIVLQDSVYNPVQIDKTMLLVNIFDRYDLYIAIYDYSPDFIIGDHAPGLLINDNPPNIAANDYRPQFVLNDSKPVIDAE